MTIVQKIVKARELPPEWARAFSDPEAQVRVELREVDAELEAAGTLTAVMDLISDRAERRGLTPQVLQSILDDR